MTPDTNMRKRCTATTPWACVPAFTLMELMVVVSIITLLISLLVPSLKKARQQAKLTVCLANLGGLAKSSDIYATEDRNDMSVPVHRRHNRERWVGAFEWGGKAGVGDTNSPGAWWLSRWGTLKFRGPATRPLNPYQFKAGFQDWGPNEVSSRGTPGPNRSNWLSDTRLKLDIYRCPADAGYVGRGGWFYSHNDPSHYSRNGVSAYDHYGTSYFANVLWVAPTMTDLSSGCRLMTNSVYYKPQSRIPNPAKTIYYQDVASRFSWLHGDFKYRECSSWTNARMTNGNWHGTDWVHPTSFVDGHATVINMDGQTWPAPHLDHYPDSRGDEEADYNYYSCVIIRGPGWQLDTLPAPPTTTAIPCSSPENGPQVDDDASSGRG